MISLESYANDCLSQKLDSALTVSLWYSVPDPKMEHMYYPKGRWFGIYIRILYKSISI